MYDVVYYIYYMRLSSQSES